MKKLFFVLFCLALGQGLASAHEPVRLRIMTYNLRFGELASLDSIGAYIASRHPDLVALQELDYLTNRQRAPRQHGKDFVTELGYHTHMWPLYGKTIPYAGGYYGIGMLVGRPYISVRKVMLPKQEAAHEARALLLAEVEVSPCDTIIFACTHLDYTSAESRAAQLEVITKVLQSQRFPVLLGGDFNTVPDSWEMQKYFAGWCTLSSHAQPTSPATAPRRKKDHLMGYPRDGWKLLSTGVENVLLSDHLPVFSEVELVR